MRPKRSVETPEQARWVARWQRHVAGLMYRAALRGREKRKRAKPLQVDDATIRRYNAALAIEFRKAAAAATVKASPS